MTLTSLRSTLNTDQWKALGNLLKIQTSPYWPHQPTPKQFIFLRLQCKEAFFGGSVGGGKSDALLMAALQYAHVPGYSAGIFRRTFADLDLPGNIMDRAKNWLAPYKGIRWNEKRHQFTFPSGARLTFGYLETDSDVRRYMGAEFQFLGCDELTQLGERPYRMLFSRLRRTNDIPVPLRMRSASNPGDVGHYWVKERFGIGQKDELGNFVKPPKGRLFIPSSVYDNPHLNVEEYVNDSLSELDEVTKQRLLHGDWDVTDEGGMFKRIWFEMVSPSEFLKRNIRLVKIGRIWDTAGTVPNPQNPDPDWTAGVKMGKDTTGHYWVLSVVRMRGTPKQVDTFMLETANNDRRLHGMDCVQVLKREPADAGIRLAAYHRNMLQDSPVVVVKDIKNKHKVAIPVSNATQSGNVSVVRGPNVIDFLDECDAFSPESKSHDDTVDCYSTGYNWLRAKGEFNFGVAGDDSPSGDAKQEDELDPMQQFITADGSHYLASR